MIPKLAVGAPDLLARLEQLERRVAELEAQRDADDDVKADGRPRPGRWCKTKETMR